MIAGVTGKSGEPHRHRGVVFQGLEDFSTWFKVQVAAAATAAAAAAAAAAKKRLA